MTGSSIRTLKYSILTCLARVHVASLSAIAMWRLRKWFGSEPLISPGAEWFSWGNLELVRTFDPCFCTPQLTLFTGKTLFLWYLFVRLLRMKQPVLFHLTRTTSLLFWDSAVYTTPSDLVQLPIPLNNSFIWSLFDVKDCEKPPDVATYVRCFPVQVPSPSDGRYKIWRKEQGPLFAAFPLWIHEELTIV